jgi:DNA-binding transcriptional ArsR family regulator
MVVPTATTIEVIAEPTRRRILDELLEGEQPVNSLVERLGMTQPVVSKHLRILRDAGLVEVRPDGQRRLYRLQPQPLMELDEWLEPYRQMWRESLDRLERHLQQPQ